MRFFRTIDLSLNALDAPGIWDNPPMFKKRIDWRNCYLSASAMAFAAKGVMTA
jgi:hypothetical protein